MEHITEPPNSPPSKQSGHAGQTPWWTVRRALGHQQDLEQGQAKVLLALGNTRYQEVVLPLWHSHSQLWPPTRDWGFMHQYVGAPSERITINVAGPFPQCNQENWYFLIAMGYFTKWLKAYVLPNQEALTAAEVLVTNVSCHFRVPRELHSDQDCNFASHLMQEVLQHLGVSKTWTTPLVPQSDSIVEWYIKTVKQHLRKVVAFHQRG
jgi:hypothetical protein